MTNKPAKKAAKKAVKKAAKKSVKKPPKKPAKSPVRRTPPAPPAPQAPRTLELHAKFAPDDLRPLGRLAFLRSGETVWEAPESARFLCPAPLWRGNGLPPAIKDAMPAGWGLAVLRDAFDHHGLSMDPASLLEHGLAWDGPGCLVFGAENASVLAHALPMDDAGLRKLARAMGRFRSEAGLPAGMEAPLAAGSGLSRGLRPKLLLGLRGDGKEIRHTGGDLPEGWTHWLVKVTDAKEPHGGLAEWIWAQAAVASGLEMPETRLFDGRFFGVRRFDRPTPTTRTHLLSAQGAWEMLGLGHRPFQHYSDLLDLTRRLTGSATEVERMAHWIAVNLALGNRDDHPGNYGFVAGTDGQWRTGPAYDITPVHADAFGFILPSVAGGLRAQAEAIAKGAQARTRIVGRILEGAQVARKKARSLVEAKLKNGEVPQRVGMDWLRRIPGEW